MKSSGVRLAAKVSGWIALAAFSSALGAGEAEQGGVNAQTFHPVEDKGPFITTTDTQTLGKYGFVAGVFLNSAGSPVVVVREAGGEKPLVRSLVTSDVLAAFGVHERVQLSIAIPANLYMAGQSLTGGRDFSSTAFGDLRTRVKVQILNRDEYGVGLAVIPQLTLPTGDKGLYGGDDGVTGGGNIAADSVLPFPWLMKQWIVGGSLGVVGRKSVPLPDEALGTSVNFGLGANIPITDSVQFVIDLLGRTTASSFLTSRAGTPVELDGAIRYVLADDFGINITIGGGRGLTHGIGSPSYRVFAGAEMTFKGFKQVDTDGDGVDDSDDGCVTVPEDIDGNQDSDGCPDLPVTFEGRLVDAKTGGALTTGTVTFSPGGATHAVTDSTYRYVTDITGHYWIHATAESRERVSIAHDTYSGYTTFDTIRMPLAKATVYGVLFDIESSLPVTGAVSVEPGGGPTIAAPGGRFRLALDPEHPVYHLTAASGGYLPHALDVTVSVGLVTNVSIPLQPSPIQVTGVVVDAASGLPLPLASVVIEGLVEPLVSDDFGLFRLMVASPMTMNYNVSVNGYESQTSSVEVRRGGTVSIRVALKRKRIKVTSQKLELDPLFFETGKAIILKKSHSVLDAVVEFLKEWPSVKIRVEGHTDDKGSDKTNLRLSQGRTDSVVEYLTQHGIDSTRLEAKGYGESRPVAPNATEEGRSKNRRVDFVIVSGEVGSETPPPPPAGASAPATAEAANPVTATTSPAPPTSPAGLAPIGPAATPDASDAPAPPVIDGGQTGDTVEPEVPTGPSGPAGQSEPDSPAEPVKPVEPNEPIEPVAP